MGRAPGIHCALQDKEIIVFHEEGFQLPAPFQCWEKTEDTDMFLCFLKTIQQVTDETNFDIFSAEPVWSVWTQLEQIMFEI